MRQFPTACLFTIFSIFCQKKLLRKEKFPNRRSDIVRQRHFSQLPSLSACLLGKPLGTNCAVFFLHCSHVIICYCNFVSRHFWHKIDKKTLNGRIILIFGYILHSFHLSTEGLPNTFPQCRLPILKRLLKLSTLPVIAR